MPPFAYDPDGPGAQQPGLPGFLPEEDPLPSEVVLSGGILDRRRREARAALCGLLLDRPPDLPPEEWRVVVATLASPTASFGRVPGSPAKTLAAVQVARQCFPGLHPSTALRRFKEVQDRPSVRAFLADFRALELADILEQRAMVREALHATIRRGAEALHSDGLDPATAPNEWARVSACTTAACKVLTDMDRLALQPEEVEAGRGKAEDVEDASVGDALAAKLRPVLADVKARRQGVLVGG